MSIFRGMQARVDEAHDIRRRAIADAFSALRVLEIEDWQVNY